MLTSIYESINDGVCVNEIIYNDAGHPIDYRILDTNPAYESITGYKRENITGQRASVVYGVKSPPHLYTYAKVAENGDKANFEIYIPQQGRHLKISVTSPEKGKFITILTDITGQRGIDEELNIVYENVPVVLMLVNSERRVLKLNKNAEIFAGKSSDELLGMRSGEVLGCLYSLDKPEGCGFGPNCKYCKARNTVLDTFETGNNHYNVEVSLPFIVDGREKYITSLLSTSLINTGYEPKVLVSIQDITEKKTLEKEVHEKNEFLKDITENMWDMVSLTDKDCNFVYVSPPHEHHLGYSFEDLANRNIFEFIHPDDLEYIKNLYSEFLQTLKPVRAECRFRHSDGHFVWLETSVNVVYDDYGYIKYFVFNSRDITERKETEDKLKESEKRFRTLTEKAADSIIAHDFDGNIVYVNELASRYLGYSKDELLSMNIIDIDPYVDIDIFREKYWKKTYPDFSYLVGTYHKKKDGTIFPVEIKLSRINLGGRPVILCFVRDISYKKQMEEHLRSERNFFKKMAETLPVGVVHMDKDGNILYVNHTAENIFGLPVSGIQKRKYDDILWNIKDLKGNHYPKENLPFELVKKSKKPVYDVKHSIEESDGQKKYLSINAAPVLDLNKNFDGVIAAIDNITDNIKKKKELKKSERKFRSYVDNSPISIFVINKDGYYVDVNKTAAYVTGYDRDELLNMNVYDLTPYNSHELLKESLNQLLENGKVSVELPFITKSGAKKYRVLDAVKLSDDKYLGFTTDITERKKTEQHLKKQKEKIINAERTRQLELHHRIKNNLQVISSLLSLQSEKFNDDEIKEAFIDTQNRVISMSLVHNKLYQTKGIENVNIRYYIEDLVNHLAGLYGGTNIDINIDVRNIYLGIDTIIPLGMLINEIVSNSLKYAFSENETGEIDIKLYQDNNGNYILIVADNGCGLPEGIDSIETDTLGLQLINSLIDQINGDFELDTSSGTKFVIEFSD